MFEGLFTYRRLGALYGAVEHRKSGDKERISLLLLTKKSQELQLHTQASFDDLESLAKSLGKRSPLFLVLNNQEVLSKTVDKEPVVQKALQKAFPAIRITDFYYEIVQMEKTTHLSVCRKETMDALLNDYQKKGIHIVGFSLGNCAMVQLAPIIGNKEVLSSNGKLTYTNNQLNTIVYQRNPNNTTYMINGLQINNKKLLTLAGILSYYTGAILTDTNFKEQVQNLSKKYRSERYWKRGLRAGLLLLFCALLLNFLLLSHTRERLQKLSKKDDFHGNYEQSLLSLEQRLEKKKGFLTDRLRTPASKTSFYLDRIGQGIPTTLRLNALEYQPLEQKIDTSKEIVIQENTIRVAGDSHNGKDFSNWLRSLEAADWVKKVEILHYGTDKNQQNTFLISIRFL